MDKVDLEDVARKCAETTISGLRDIDAVSIVELAEGSTEVNLTDAQVDAVARYCSQFADVFQKALDHVKFDPHGGWYFRGGASE